MSFCCAIASVSKLGACFVDCSLTALSNSTEDVSDYTDIELIQHINVDCVRLMKLLNGGFAFLVFIRIYVIGHVSGKKICVDKACMYRNRLFIQ